MTEPKKKKEALTQSDYHHLQELFKPHVDSFDHLIETGLESMISHIKPVRFSTPTQGPSFKFHSVRTNSTPHRRNKALSADPFYLASADSPKLLILAGSMWRYASVVHLSDGVCYRYNDKIPLREKINFGYLPVMLKSKLCHLRGVSPAKLVSYREEATEMGGYFILNGLERLVRLLIMQKRNYPMNVVRDSFKERQEGYTDKAVVIRCVRGDQSSVTNKLYYLQNGSARMGFWVNGREYLLPVAVVLKALINTNDREIIASLTGGCSSEINQRVKGAVSSQLVGERVKIILDEVKELKVFTQAQCVQHIGEYFQPVMYGMEKESHTVVGQAILDEFILVHLANGHEKFNLLIFMLQKLFALVDQTAAPDNNDALQNQEVLLPAHLVIIYLKEKLQEWLYKAKKLVEDEIAKNGERFEFMSLVHVKKVIERNSPKNVGLAIENMLKTGRLITRTGLDLQQRGGMTIQAERLNFLRFISHFRSVHRGASFAGQRNTSVRKLLPESWGFLYPVHTPDGGPCGLLNHLSSTCRITSYFDSQGKVKDFFKIRLSILNVLSGIGMTPSSPILVRAGLPDVLVVLLDGCVVGFIPSNLIEKAVAHIRRLKLSAFSGIPDDLEVGYVPLNIGGGAYPGLYLFTTPARFVRPVRNISPDVEEKQDIELIGPFEQVYMEIKCHDGGDGGRKENFPATHEEISPFGIFSVVASLTPYSDHNQSPRNMYQCQMAKQTMAFSAQALQFRADQKLYHLHTPQTPIVRTSGYTKYNIDEFPTGTNAIVAVTSYTAYDMEDAMILNKSSVERGMFRGSIYQVETVDLEDDRGRDQAPQLFARSNTNKSFYSLIDSDGLPYVGRTIQPSEPYCSIYNTVTNTSRVLKLKGSEPAVIDYVLVDVKNQKKPPQKINVRFRRERNPVVGDKFSSRHGQKGVCSQLWPDIDMPFSGVTGMRPDLIINPHAFPSRMTIGMLLESIAAKAGGLRGEFVDATPFVGSEKKTDGESLSKSTSLIDDLGPLLTSKGFNYHGSEVLYSGVLGKELTCEIFIGPVYYQRLRHMVSDKFQVRSTGIVDQATRQPIKGRKRGGGIRFGEMERDSMLAHGAAYLLHDRLHTCSDHHIADVCSLCGSILATSFIQPQKKAEISLPHGRTTKRITCHACKTSKGMETVAMPYVFRYLAAELAAMNVKMTLQLSNGVEA